MKIDLKTTLDSRDMSMNFGNNKSKNYAEMLQETFLALEKYDVEQIGDYRYSNKNSTL